VKGGFETGVFWALIVIAAVYALVKYPAFRKSVLAIAGVLAVMVLGYMLYDKQQAEASKRLVRAEELEFTDMRLGPEEFGSSYKLVGRVKNNSRYAVFSIQAKVRVLDCDEKSHCDVVGEEERDIAPFVPAGQARDIDTSLYFSSGTKVRNQFQWSYTIGEIRARVE
jgi:hypothetical protein